MTFVDNLACLFAMWNLITVFVKERRNTTQVLAETTDQHLLEDGRLLLSRMFEDIRAEIKSAAIVLFLVFLLRYKQVLLHHFLQL